MSYETLVAFETALRDAGYTVESTAKADIMFQYYRHAAKQDFMVLGRNEETKPLMENLGNIYEGGIIGQTPDHAWGWDKKWSLMLNDCMIMGGIHGHVEFTLLGQPDAHERVVAIGSDNVFYVTGREVIGLTTFGYSPSTVYGQTIYNCTTADLADAATFSQYIKRLNEVADHGTC